MELQPLRMPRPVFFAGGAVCLLAGASWAAFGPEIFITSVMAGIAGCF
jgi:hypothetical protein